MKLNSKQRKAYNEILAKLILCSVYKNKFSSAICSESPDIQDFSNNVGVEVTSALKQNIRECLYHAISTTGKTKDTLQNYDKRFIESKRINVVETPQGRYQSFTTSFWGNVLSYKEIIAQKLEKLNGLHFKKFLSNELFVFADFADKEDVNEFVEYLLHFPQNKMRFEFDIYYIYCDGILTEIDIKQQSVLTYEISFEHQQELHNKVLGEVGVL